MPSAVRGRLGLDAAQLREKGHEAHDRADKDDGERLHDSRCAAGLAAARPALQATYRRTSHSFGSAGPLPRPILSRFGTKWSVCEVENDCLDAFLTRTGTRFVENVVP